MDNYDIIHLEDDRFIRRLIEISSQQRGLTYKPVGTLHDLKEALETSRANFYVVDGSFPPGGPGCSGRSETLASEAVDYIRERCGNPVIIYTAHDSLQVIGMEEYDVVHVRKDGNVQKLFSAMDASLESN
jgi:hypothetical protein